MEAAEQEQRDILAELRREMIEQAQAAGKRPDPRMPPREIVGAIMAAVPGGNWRN